MIEKKCTNEDLEIELTSYIDDKQNFFIRVRISLRSVVIVILIRLLENMYLKITK